MSQRILIKAALEQGEELTPIDALRRFGIEELVLTRGAAGGLVQTRAGHTCPYAAVPVDRLVDATGAGDVFFAAYVYHRRYEHASIQDAAHAAAETAALQVSDRFIRRATLAMPGEVK